MGGSLTDEELAETKSYGMKYFVELGTYKAETTRLVAPHYEHVYSIEIHDGLYNEALESCKDYNNITLVHGDTIEQVGSIAEKLGGETVFFVDSHISGHDSSWNGKNRVPVFEELEMILPHISKPSVFIFDDLRFWTSQKAWDWSHISNMGILGKFKNNGIKIKAFYEKNDRFWVITA